MAPIRITANDFLGALFATPEEGKKSKTGLYLWLDSVLIDNPLPG